jgi:hypothetical protein
MTWISSRTQSPFELINDGRGIKCTINGTIKVEISMTVVVHKDPDPVIVDSNPSSETIHMNGCTELEKKSYLIFYHKSQY